MATSCRCLTSSSSSWLLPSRLLTMFINLPSPSIVSCCVHSSSRNRQALEVTLLLLPTLLFVPPPSPFADLPSLLLLGLGMAYPNFDMITGVSVAVAQVSMMVLWLWVRNVMLPLVFLLGEIGTVYTNLYTTSYVCVFLNAYIEQHRAVYPLGVLYRILKAIQTYDMLNA